MSQEIVKIEDIVGGANIELNTNKTFDVNASSTDDEYPSAKAVHLAVDEKVTKISGKDLSTNDYTTTEKNKLAGIAAGAEVNVNADWNAVSGDAQILNKPTLSPSDAEKNIIVGVQKNGTDLVPDVNRKVNVTVPTVAGDIGAEPAKGTDDNYVTDAEKIVLSNTSGTNTGDQDLSGYSPTTHRHDGETLIPDVVEFQTPAVIPTAIGSVYYDEAKKVLSTVLDGAVLQNGLELYVRIVNKTGVQIDDGQAVYINGAQGNRPTAALAIATSNIASNVIGVATQDIAINAEGFVTVFGDVDFNTTGLTDGATLHLSATTAGALVETIPTFPNHKVCVATVLNSTTNGRIFVRPFHVFELAELHGVDLTETTPLDTDSILIQQTATGLVKKTLFTTIKAFLKTYFDTLYAKISGQVFTGAISATNLSGTNTGDETNATLSTKINASAAKTILVDADLAVGLDSAASFGLIKTTWLNVWTYISSKITSALVTGKLITGFVSGSGTVAAADTILQAINKLDGNIALRALLTTLSTEQIAGLIKIANAAEAASGIDDTKAMTAVKEYISSKLNHPMLEGNLADLNMVPFNIYSEGLIFPKAQGKGIKIDTDAPTYGWKDLIGYMNVDAAALNAASQNVFIGTLIRRWAFSAGDKSDFEFHIPHDYVPGTDLYIHYHWAHNGTAISGNIVGTFAYTYADGYGGVFSAEKTSAATYNTVNIATTPRYVHRIEEIQLSSNGGSATLLDSALIKVDGIIGVNFTMTTIPTITGGSPNEPFVILVDIHYQSTQLATKTRNTPFYT